MTPTGSGPTIASVIEIASEHPGAQNHRFVVALGDGAAVEAVLYRGDSLCVSTQVGCAVRCPFCASGAGGLARNLSLAELVGQIEAVRSRGHALARVTFSGIGEPLHNATAVRDAIDWCRSAGLAPSLTTSGGPTRRLREALGWPHNGLTVSVHAGTDAVRARLVPEGPRLDELFATLREGVSSLGTRRRKKLALAYLLVARENEAPEELEAFADRAVPLGLAVHLYAYNPVRTSQAAPVARAGYERAWKQLRDRGLVVRMSSTARTEGNGGCGTLVASRRGAA